VYSYSESCLVKLCPYLYVDGRMIVRGELHKDMVESYGQAFKGTNLVFSRREGMKTFVKYFGKCCHYPAKSPHHMFGSALLSVCERNTYTKKLVDIQTSIAT
jgi:hypothetical protein